MNPTRNNSGKFKKAYSKKQLVNYIKGVAKAIKRSPTYRDLKKFPGPTASTIIRYFGKWSNAIKAADLRPLTHQLIKGEKTFIRDTWHSMTDKQISKKLNVPLSVIRYYRLSKKLWKNTRNKKLVASTQKRMASHLYGKNCEICNIPITELHHIVPKSKSHEDWAVLCPLCHAIITRGIISVKNRRDLFKKLKPCIKKIYSENLRI